MLAAEGTAMEEFEKFILQLEDLGEPEVRERFAHGVFVARSKRYAEEWLRRKDEERAEARSSLRDEREERTL